MTAEVNAAEGTTARHQIVDQVHLAAAVLAKAMDDSDHRTARDFCLLPLNVELQACAGLDGGFRVSHGIVPVG